jgi:hypothetical protein
MLFGLMESPKSQGKQDPAESVRREFEAAWAKVENGGFPMKAIGRRRSAFSLGCDPAQLVESC